jgi:hypothetical protein
VRRFLSANNAYSHRLGTVLPIQIEKAEPAQPAQKLMLRRQKRFDRQLEEGTLKDSTTCLPRSPTNSAHPPTSITCGEITSRHGKQSTVKTESLR